MIARLFLLMEALLLLAATPVIWAQDPGVPDTVRIAFDDLHWLCLPTDSAPARIYLWNDEPICGFSLGIQFEWGPYYILGISKAGGIIPPGPEPSCLCPPQTDSNRACIGWLDFTGSNCIPAATGNVGGLLVTVYVRAHAVSQYYGVKVDSLFLPPACQFQLTTAQGQGFTPRFVSAPYFCDDVQDPQRGELGQLLQMSNVGAVAQNYPNPFNSATTIDIKIARSTAVSL